MVFQKIIKIINKIGQWGIGVIRPIFGEKVVIKNINDYSAVMTIVFMQAFSALSYYGVLVRISVNCTMEYNALLNFFPS